MQWGEGAGRSLCVPALHWGSWQVLRPPVVSHSGDPPRSRKHRCQPASSPPGCSVTPAPHPPHCSFPLSVQLFFESCLVLCGATFGSGAAGCSPPPCSFTPGLLVFFS